ncbi:eukaryotic initiation factor 4F subunit P130 [Coprinopsis cinerea okayama7|uniref:Eukaryotic initiation factor 4F subunit P130 n=1 Tax=Coprinopsis cinerea (strain Okayama-7 / 130 / ATCC MYA-4618 / FGSC 9003) TaxID=240176 RepID=A8N5R4_COPC7|nr:eukaryotic initiation factor 4F subunit P130 [Coprinopsis cinerea okayama7\|eukprot:XP_001830209.1 eukaryotic initiation factor 4F subunit P130 [Coprinopsis cinerea okayama7\
MSKSSTTSTNKSLPAKSAWSKGPPQTSAPSPRSQSPAPSAQSQPHLTHSRRPSALGQAIPIKDGVSVPRNNVGAAAAKTGSAVTFGSIDDASAPISSSPAAAPPTLKETIVKSFGTVPAASSNGKPTQPSRPAVSTASASTTATSSSSATPSSSAPPAKLDKKDIAKLFQSSSAPAPSPSETQSPAPRNANLPSQNQPPPTPTSSSQPSQFNPHYRTFVPGGSQPQGSGPNSGPSRSPVYQRPVPNGAGPRPQAPPNGAPSAGMSSPRLGPPHAQPGPPPAAPPVPGQPHMPTQMVWNGGYYYPPEYVPYGAWGYVPPGMPPQSAHPHPPPHMGPPPHMTPHPISPHNPPRTLQPGTPTMPHAAPNPVHPPHPPPPLSQPHSSINTMSSPPPTPSGGRLNVNSNAFVPQTSKRITLKNSEGKEVAIESLTKPTATPTTTVSSGQGTPYRQNSPASTPKRSSIRIESEDQRRKRLAEEEEAREKEKRRAQEEAEAKAKEEERKKKEEEEKEKERLRLEEEKKEEERKKKEEEERKRREEEERIQKEKEEKERAQREEEERKKREEEERIKKEEEEKKRVRQEEERKKREEEEASRKAKEEEERKKKEEEEEKRRQAEAAEKEKAEKAAREQPEEGEIQEPAPPTVPKEDPKEKLKEGLRINTATSNAADLGKRRPANLDLSATKGVPVASALSTARNLESLDSIKYPEGIQSPKPELNENAKPGRFRYDRDFLLQFREVCKDRPPNLPPLDAIGLEPIDPSALHITRGGSHPGRHGRASSTVPVRQASVGLPFGGPGIGKPGFGGMGNFTTPGRLSSEDRFAMSNAANRSASVGGPGMPFGRPAAMQRTASQGGQIRERTRSKRGEKRAPADGGKDRNASAQQQLNLEPVAPLQMSANRWDRRALAADSDSPEMVDRKVKGLLNKLTMEKFDSISDQIIAWANKSEKEKDGRTLIQVIRLVFEKATDEATWSEMYARLCRKMMEQISPKVQDDGIKNAEGRPIAGGQLFRKYLLNRCQEDFERGWVNKEATAAAAKAKAADDEAIKAANDSKKDKEGEVELYSDEYYAAQKAKRQGLGLIKFIGELFKLQMLTERIMHECVKKLLGNVDNPEEEEIESLCKLLTTVGALLDTPKAHAHMDIYFSRMKELTKSPNVSPRMQFMLQDVIELRERKWVARNAVAAPTTLAQVHQNAAKEAAQEKESMQRAMTMSRTSSNRGRGRATDEQPDGWAVAGSRPVSTKAGDLSNFGKISKAQPMTFGPSSVFSKKDKRESLSRSSSSSNMFSMLQNAEVNPEPKPEPQRKRLALLPRTLPKPDEANTNASGRDRSESGSEEEEEEKAAPEMSETDAKNKIDEDSKELFGVRNLDEAEVYFTALPAKYHHKLVDKLVSKAVESKMTDAELVASLFERASKKQLCSPSAFEEGFAPIAEFLDDIAIDAPHAFQIYVKMVKGANLDAEAHSRIAAKDPSEKLGPLLS